MENIYESCAGLDIHQDNLVACVLSGSLTSTRPKKELRKFETTTKGLQELRDWLLAHQCEAVGMESTGVYWKPVWRMLSDSFELKLANPQKIKSISSHKTDKLDAHWIAKLTRIDLLPESFVPDEDIQDLRDLTRTRKVLVESRNTEKNRIHKLLQTAGIKITSCMEDIFGASGRNLLQLLLDGEVVTAENVAPLVYSSLKKKIPQIVDSMNGFMRSHHRFLLEVYLKLLEEYEVAIRRIEERIDELLTGYEPFVEILTGIPGISQNAAAVIIAEIGTDMSHFPTARHLASWAGLSPGNNESSGKKKSTRIGKGDPYLKRTLCQVAWVASRAKDTRYRSKFHRVKQNRGAPKATIAVAHEILQTIYLLFSKQMSYLPRTEEEQPLKNAPAAS